MNTNIYSMLHEGMFNSMLHFSRNRNQMTRYYDAFWEW